MISVIIPAYNEAKALPGTLQSLYTQPGCFEVLLVDGGSRDETVQIAEAYPGLRTLRAPKGRASQMNAGAVVARGDWLLFLHADTLLPPNALQMIAHLPGDAGAGGFRHRFSGRGAGLKLVSWLHNFRCRQSGVIYGDQALFVRKTLFESLGGFPAGDMEDLYFGEILRTCTRPVILDSCVTTASRKFEQQGVWVTFLRVLVLIASAQFGFRQPEFARTFFKDAR